jgi:hypothetical protein
MQLLYRKLSMLNRINSTPTYTARADCQGGAVQTGRHARQRVRRGVLEIVRYRQTSSAIEIPVVGGRTRLAVRTVGAGQAGIVAGRAGEVSLILEVPVRAQRDTAASDRTYVGG